MIPKATIATAIMLGAVETAAAASCSSFDPEEDFRTTSSGNSAEVSVNAFSQSGTLPNRTGRTCGFAGAPGPDAASFTGDYRGLDSYFGDWFDSAGDPVSDPYASDVIWGYGSAYANYGVFRAHAVTHFEANGVRKGLSAGTRAESRETFTINHPTDNGETGELEVGVFLTGGVRLSNGGPDSEDTEPTGSGGMSVNWINSQNRIIDEVAGVSRRIGDGGTTSTVGADFGTYQFTYGEAFTLLTAFFASANADQFTDGPNGNGFFPANVTQSVEADFGATGYLGFVLPSDAMLSSVSQHGYFTAESRESLAAMIPGSGPPVPIPLPAAGWMLLSGLALLAAKARKKAA